MLAAAVCAVALWAYQPWQPAPLTPTDFSDFLPLLQSHAGVVAHWQALSRLYADEGRFFPVTLAWIAIRWSWFGLSAPAWQTAAVMLLLATTGGVYALLRRLGANGSGRLVGALLFVFSAAIRELWLRPQLGDNLGLIFLLAATWIATGYRRSTRPLAAAAGIATLLLAAEWTKETFVACIPFVIGVALCWQGENRWERPRVGRREVMLVAVVGIVTVLGLIPILAHRHGAGQGAYAAQYGLQAIGVGHSAAILSAMLLPSAESSWSASGVAFAALLVVGWIVALQRWPRRSVGTALAVALSLPLTGAAIYLPWPTFYPHYASAFLLGTAYLTAMATTALLATNRRAWWWLPSLAAACLVIQGSRAAFGATQEGLARRRLFARSVAVLPRAGEATAVILPGSAPMYAPGWFETRFSRYAAAAFDHPLPPVLPADCPDAWRSWQGQENVSLLVFGWRCPQDPGMPPPTWRLMQHYQHLSLSRLRLVTDSMEVDVWAPRGPTRRPTT